jgi:uncharacterized protein (DUF736 family)
MTDQNRGFLYPVKEKKSEKSPNMTGKIVIAPELAGKEIEIAGWTTISKAGNKYISLLVSEPYQPQQAQQPQQQTANQAQQNFNTPAQPPMADDFSDDIPF